VDERVWIENRGGTSLDKKLISFSNGIKLYYILVAAVWVFLMIRKSNLMTQGASTADQQSLYIAVVTVGILAIVPALILAWRGLYRWISKAPDVSASMRNFLLVISIPMLLVIGYMIELVLIMIFVGLGG